MNLAEYVFWVSFLLVAHTYLLYPIGLFFAYSLVQVRRDWQYLRFRRDGRSPVQDAADLPPEAACGVGKSQPTLYCRRFLRQWPKP